MKKLIATVLAALALSFQTGAMANDRATADEAVAMVHKVIDKMKASGREAVIADINAFKPEYRDRDLYVTVMDLNGLELAHGSNKKMQGVKLIDLKDTDGKPYIRERIALAKKNGKGWQDYIFVNPTNKQLEPKSMYFVLHEDIIVSAGIYKPQ